MFSPILFLLLFVAGGGFAQRVGFRPACDLRAGQLACVTFAISLMYVNECSFTDSFESSNTSHIGVRRFEASEEIERLAIYRRY
jgi:hypothetical protein